MSIDDQIARETAMANRGAGRSRSQINKSMERGDAALTPAGIALAKRGLEPLAQAITKLVEDAFAGKALGRHSPLAATLLRDVDPELAAFVTIRGALNGGAKRYSLKATAISIADRLEAELLADQFEIENEALLRSVLRNAASRGLAPERQANAMRLANKKFEVVPDMWTPTQKLHLGVKLIDLLTETLGLVESVLLRKGPRKSTQKLHLAPNVGEWFARYNASASLTHPLYLPSVVPPKPWDSPYGGAYYSPVLGRSKIITRAFPGQIEAMEKADMTTVYAGVNALQETPWRINRRVLEVMKQAWEMDAGLTCLPPREDEKLPEVPQEVIDAEKGSAVRKAWRQKMRAIHERIASGRSQRFEFGRALSIATENADRAAIYFPHRLDFRGRAYAASTSLNPQGSDDVRGLLEFAEGKPLGARGVFWLGVHGANLFGNAMMRARSITSW